MDSSLRNHAMVSLQNQQQQQQREMRLTGAVVEGSGGTDGLGASLSSHYQQQQYYSHQQQHYPQHQSFGSSFPQQQRHKQQHHHHGSQYSSSHQQHQYSSADHMSVDSGYYTRGSQTSASHNSSTAVDEAYRRLGQRLSIRAHGGDIKSYNKNRNHIIPPGLPKRVSRIGLSPQSGFITYSDSLKNERMKNIGFDMQQEEQDSSIVDERAIVEDEVNLSPSSRTNKVSKKRLSDHGDHHSHNKQLSDNTSQPNPNQEQHRSGNIVRKMTVNANELFQYWQEERAKERRGHKRSSPKTSSRHKHHSSVGSSSSSGDLSPHRQAFSQMMLEGGMPQPPDLADMSSEQQQQQFSSNTRSSHRQQHHHHRQQQQHLQQYQKVIAGDLDGGLLSNHNNGLLTAVIETSSRTSSKQTHSGNEGGMGSSKHGTRSGGGGGGAGSSGFNEDLSRGSSSIATRSSMGTRNSMRSFGQLPPQGECLTHPSQGVSNDGLDNVEGNLIVNENDTISVGRKQVHILSEGKRQSKQHADFRIISLLGQGTFAQVFKCLHVQTGKVVAMKIVKNKPAYTRQAAVEIDVFRALKKPSTNDDVKMKKTDSSNIPSPDGIDPSTEESGTKWDYMVEMICYFMYKDHLCLVFELLGLNLYEILKKRQFRGLPLMVVRTLVRQAVIGTKELAQKSIVHCDLKPENILLVTEDDVETVVSAGENRRLSMSMRSGDSATRDKKQTDQEPPDSTATVNTAGGNSGNSTSTSNTGNTQKKKQQHGQGTEQENTSKSGSLTTSKTPPTCITAHQNAWDSHSEKTPAMHPLSHSPAHSDGTHISTSASLGHSLLTNKIKLIDFGSACFEGQTSHTYIQSRFYRSPEVLIGLSYDSAIDMWSLGCVAAELFLGLPILPGIHEHDQLGRISEMIGGLPDWMLDQGTKAQKYYVKFVPPPTPTPSANVDPVIGHRSPPPARPLPQWRLKNKQEFIASLSSSEIRKKGGLSKLQKQPANRYFKRKHLADIIFDKGRSAFQEDKEQLLLFVHFLYGILDPDPWKRWTAFQAASHPFLIGNTNERTQDGATAPTGKDENIANKICKFYWEAPTDPTIYRRKLLNVQKMREKQQVARQRLNRTHAIPRTQSPGSQDGFVIDMDGNESPQSHIDGVNRSSKNHGAVHFRPGSYTGLRVQQEGRVEEDSSVASNPRHYITGPQSYSEAGPSSVLPGSFNEVDFAYALQRPGVVPMGDSVCSSFDMSSTSQVSNYGQQQYFHHHPPHTSFPLSGSYNSNRVSQRSSLTHRQATGNMSMTTRSFDEGGLAALTASESQRHHPSFLSGGSNNMGPPGEVTVGDVSQEFSSPLAPPSVTTSQLPQPANDGLAAYGNAQVYLQQQHVALQQQQLLLQQQQTALALQQQQLQAYGANPVLFNSTMSEGTGMNFQQGGAIGANGAAGMNPGFAGGYYYVAAADGTPMLMAANPGMLAQFPGQMMPILPGQISGQAIAPNSNGTDMTPIFPGMPGLMMSPGGIPGMMQMPGMSTNNLPVTTNVNNTGETPPINDQQQSQQQT